MQKTCCCNGSEIHGKVFFFISVTGVMIGRRFGIACRSGIGPSQFVSQKQGLGVRLMKNGG